MTDATYTDLVAGQRAYFKSGATRRGEWRRQQLEALKSLRGVRYPPYSEHTFERAVESKL